MAPTSLSHPLFLIAITITLVSQTRLTPASPVAPIQHLPTANTTGAAARNNLQCINSADWATTTFMAYDCYTALALFEDYEVYRYVSHQLPCLPRPKSHPFYPQSPLPYPSLYPPNHLITQPQSLSLSLSLSQNPSIPIILTAPPKIPATRPQSSNSSPPTSSPPTRSSPRPRPANTPTAAARSPSSCSPTYRASRRGCRPGGGRRRTWGITSGSKTRG